MIGLHGPALEDRISRAMHAYSLFKVQHNYRDDNIAMYKIYLYILNFTVVELVDSISAIHYVMITCSALEFLSVNVS